VIIEDDIRQVIFTNNGKGVYFIGSSSIYRHDMECLFPLNPPPTGSTTESTTTESSSTGSPVVNPDADFDQTNTYIVAFLVVGIVVGVGVVLYCVLSRIQINGSHQGNYQKLNNGTSSSKKSQSDNNMDIELESK
jgi:hypothetical protein